MPRRTYDHMEAVEAWMALRRRIRLMRANPADYNFPKQEIERIRVLFNAGGAIELPKQCDCPACRARRKANADSDAN